MIKPLGSRLFVEKIERKEFKTQSGILMSDEPAPESVWGKVLAVGPECKDFKVGDTVIYAQYAPTQAKETPADKTYIVPAEDVIAIVTS